jgi:hypothetical protein
MTGYVIPLNLITTTDTKFYIKKQPRKSKNPDFSGLFADFNIFTETRTRLYVRRDRDNLCAL